jgi:hypothetical protein
VDSKTRKFLIVLAVTAGPFCVGMVFVLTSVFGSPTIGVRCSRSGGPARCEVLQSSFFGLAGNSSFVIRESEIRGARTLRPLPHVGRGTGEYSASLMLKTGAYRDYPVLHSRFFARADGATRKLNDYFADTAAQSIELREDSSEIIFPLAPLAVIPIVLTGLALRRRVRRTQP